MRKPAAALALLGGVAALGALGAGEEEAFDFPILLPKWVDEFTVKTGAGYRDNVTLSAHRAQDSAFIMTGAEAILLRLPENNTRYNLFLSAEDLRFLDTREVDKEQTAFAQAQVTTDCGAGWQVAAAAEYVYQNQVLDVSTTEAVRTTLPVEGHGILVRGQVRHEFDAGYSVSLELSAKRQFYHAPLDDYWEYGPRVVLGKSYGRQSELSVSYGIQERPYDTEVLREADGAPVPGSRRTSVFQDVRLSWKHTWDARSRWRSSTRLLAGQSDDNGTGFFNYTKLQAGGQVLYRTAAWELSAEGRATQYRYPVQLGSDLARRRSTELLLTVRCERRLTRYLKLSAEYEYNRVFSNLEPERYTVNTVKGGLLWVF